MHPATVGGFSVRKKRKVSGSVTYICGQRNTHINAVHIGDDTGFGAIGVDDGNTKAGW